MGVDDIAEEMEWWIHESIEESGAQEDDFFIEKFEHAFIARWGSKKGDFPVIATTSILKETNIIVSGERDGAVIISDTDAKTFIDVEQLAYKHFLETLMKDREKGYVVETKPMDGEVFKITVERIKPKEN